MGNPIASKELFKAAFNDFIIQETVPAPFTTIVNRAEVSNSLKAIAGVERVAVYSINPLSNEFGPNGEIVSEPSNIKDSRFRFVGAWRNLSDTNGPRALTLAINDYVEITFYGTGLNLLGSLVSGMNIVAKTDGGAESANLIPATIGPCLSSRNYRHNEIVSVVKGLSLGWHTVSLRNNHASNGFNFLGVEIVNERSDVATAPGTAIVKGAPVGLNDLESLAFKDGVIGTRGARVVKYIENGQLKSAVQEVDATSKFLSNADHTNEEVIRRFHYREFGAQRADDFSTIAAANTSRAFTLDDGTTTLTTKDATGSATFDTIEFLTAGSSGTPWDWTLTFVGTGLDLLIRNRNIVTTVVSNLYVDGELISQIPKLLIDETRMTKICSGLPYGTHTVRIHSPNVSGQSPHILIADMITYQPKKPSIPEDAIEVADYNVMADYIAPTSSVPLLKSATGTIRKFNIREITYSGAWTAPVLDVVNGEGGFFTVLTSGVGAFFEYTFFGTGFNINIPGGTSGGVTTSTVSVNGATNLTGAGYSTSIITAGAATFNGATGVISVPLSAAIFTVSVTDMPLGLYTVRVTKTTGTANSYCGSFDFITPIHINNSNLKEGNLSLKPSDKFSPEKQNEDEDLDMGSAKAWLFYDMATDTIEASHNISAVFKNTTGAITVYFDKQFKNANYVPLVSASSFEAAFTNGTRFANRIQIIQANSAGTALNGEIYAAFYGELFDE